MTWWTPGGCHASAAVANCFCPLEDASRKEIDVAFWRYLPSITFVYSRVVQLSIQYFTIVGIVQSAVVPTGG
jgi:hypothetical protein